MAIETDRNESYGGTSVVTKYAPLKNIRLVTDDRKIYSKILTNRSALLNAKGMLPKKLTLATLNWTNTINAERFPIPPAPAVARPATLSPLVVISSNRSAWMRKALDIAAAQLEAAVDGNAFSNVSDLRALTGYAADQDVSPPLYSPLRIGPNRNVYVVVHMTEYKTYVNALAGTAVKVVGYSFARPAAREADGLVLTGFGASRFAAIQFCKELRAQANAPWGSAWLLDDNAVGLQNFAGFAAVEAALTADYAAAGFSGSSDAGTFDDTTAWARKQINEGYGQAPAALARSQPPGILQQVVLWNIAYLTTHALNFGPAYVASGEDVSMGKYFDAKEIPYLWYKGISVFKEVTTYDNGEPGKAVNAYRQKLTKYLTDGEGGNSNAPPPPINVSPAQGDGGDQTLASFIVNCVLPNANLVKAKAGDPVTQTNAKCQAAEQITIQAIEDDFVTKEALATVFNVNGQNNPLAVTRANVAGG